MIYISESNTDEANVVIKVEGALNSETLPIFEEVYVKHLSAETRIAVDLGEIMSIDRNAKAFLKRIKDAVLFIDMPAYLELELGMASAD